MWFISSPGDAVGGKFEVEVTGNGIPNAVELATNLIAADIHIEKVERFRVTK